MISSDVRKYGLRFYHGTQFRPVNPSLCRTLHDAVSCVRRIAGPQTLIVNDFE